MSEVTEEDIKGLSKRENKVIQDRLKLFARKECLSVAETFVDCSKANYIVAVPFKCREQFNALSACYAEQYPQINGKSN
jgi:hypothetical protein